MAPSEPDVIWYSQMLSIFLDQNHWIALSRTYYGRPNHCQHIEALHVLTSKVQTGEVILPLQISHLVEFSRSNNEARRNRLARVFEEFSQNWFFAPWSSILPFELSFAVAKTFGTKETLPKPQVFGEGVLFSLGARARQELLASGKLSLGLEFHEQLASYPGALLDLLTFPNEDGRKTQVAKDRERRKRYAAAWQQTRDSRDPLEQSQREQAEMYTFEHQGELQRRLIAAGKAFDDFVALGPEGMSDFFDNVPTLDVDRTLSIYRNRQWTRQVEGNDLNDLGYLALAIPYCDVVLVENFWGHAIRSLYLDAKYGTQVFTDIGELVGYLKGEIRDRKPFI